MCVCAGCGSGDDKLYNSNGFSMKVHLDQKILAFDLTRMYLLFGGEKEQTSPTNPATKALYASMDL